MPESKESGTNHTVSSPPAIPDRDYDELRGKMCEVEEHLREVDSVKGSTVFGEIKKVVLMKILFDDLRLCVRRQELHSDNFSYDDLRALLMERASIKDEERAVKGSLEVLDDACLEPA